MDNSQTAICLEDNSKKIISFNGGKSKMDEYTNCKAKSKVSEEVVYIRVTLLLIRIKWVNQNKTTKNMGVSMVLIWMKEKNLNLTKSPRLVINLTVLLIMNFKDKQLN